MLTRNFYILSKLMLNYEFILKKSAESHIDRITIEREYWQLLFLQQFYLLKKSNNIFFKGGTAIRFLFNSFRFSEDLDFLSNTPKKQTEELLFEVFNFFKKNSNSQLEFKKEKIIEKFEQNSLKYRFLFLPYNSNQKVSIRIDVTFREKPIKKEKSVLIPFDYPISPYPLILHLNSEEILAEKIRALFVREKPRDLFDLWFLLSKNISINENMVKKKFELYKNLKFSRESLKTKINLYNEKDLKIDLNQFLPTNYRQFYRDLKKKTLEFLK